MTSPIQCVGKNQTLADVAQMMRDLDVGALPICGDQLAELVGSVTRA